MSIGNLKDSGNQGNNFPWQWKMLQGLQDIFNEVSQPLTCVEDSVTICAPAGGLDVNLHDGAGNAITSTVIGADTGIDVNIIGGVTLEVNLDAADDQVGIYGYVSGAAGSPVPLNVNATGQVAIQDGGNSITTDTTQLPATLGQTNMAGSVSVTLANNQLGIARTPGILRPTAAGNVNSVAATFYSVSIANVGAANGSVLGGASNIKPGEVLNFSADAVNNYFTTFAYDATGTEFIIIYVS
jgi:hypothetical protein